MNVPLPAGFDDAGYLDVYRRLLVPVADSYRPQLVLVSAGFDAHRDDPLAGMAMTERGFAALAGIVRSIADAHCEGRIVLILEGGYALPALAASVMACCKVLLGGEPPVIAAPDEPRQAVVDALAAFHAAHWPELASKSSQ